MKPLIALIGMSVNSKVFLSRIYHLIALFSTFKLTLTVQIT